MVGAAGHQPGLIDEEWALLDADTVRRSTDTVVARMQRDNVRYAYVQALPEFRRKVEHLFRRPQFQLVHESTIVPGERLGVQRTHSPGDAR